MDRGASLKSLNVNTPEYIYLKLLKLIRKIEVPQDKKSCKTTEKVTIMIKNTLGVLQEERKDLQKFALGQFKKVQGQAIEKVDGFFETFKKFICPKKAKKSE